MILKIIKLINSDIVNVFNELVNYLKIIYKNFIMSTDTCL